MTKRAILAARVSTDLQGKYGYSLETQMAAMRQYAKSHRFKVVAEIQDDCSGTIPIRERPGGARIYEMIDRGLADVLVFYTVDRATRDEDLIELAVLRRDLRQAGMELHFCDSGQSDLTTLGGLVDNIKAALAAEERKKILERTKRGRRAKAADKWVGVGPAPLGYRRVGQGKDVKLVIDESEAQIVRRIFSLYVGAGGNSPIALIAIANLFNREGVPVAGKKKNAGGWGPGKGWYPITIKKILSRRIYVGECVFAGQTALIPELAIIDRVTFEKAQVQMQTNLERAKRNRKYEYLLTGGFIKCACGANMTGKTEHGGKFHYYRCNQTKVKTLALCREGYLIGREVDTKVWSWLVNLVKDEETLLRGINRMIERAAAANAPRRARVEALNDLIDKAERKLKRLMSSFGDLDDDDPASAVLKAEVKTTSRQLIAYKAEHERVKAEIEAGEMTDSERQGLLDKAVNLRDGMANADFETKRYFLDRLNVQCRVWYDELGNKRLALSCALSTESESVALTASARRSLARWKRFSSSARSTTA